MTGRVPGPTPGTPPPRVAGKKDSLPTPPCLTPGRYGTATASERAARVMTADRGIAGHGEASPPSTRFGVFPAPAESTILSSPDSRQSPVQTPFRASRGALHNCDYIQIPDSGDATWAS